MTGDTHQSNHLRQHGYSGSGWRLAQRIQFRLYRAPLQTVDDLLSWLKRDPRTPESYEIDEFRSEPLSAQHVLLALKYRLAGFVEVKDGCWYKSTDRRFIPPLWMRTPFGWHNEAAHGASDAWHRFCEFLTNISDEDRQAYQRQFPEPPHWRTFYDMVARLPHDYRERDRGIDIFARREFRWAMQWLATGDTLRACVRFARIVEHCCQHPLWLPAHAQYEQLRQLHVEVQDSSFDRYKFHRHVAQTSTFRARAIAQICNSTEDEERRGLPDSARKRVRISHKTPFSETVSWTVWESQSGMHGVRSEWNDAQTRRHNPAQLASVEPRIIREQCILDAAETSACLLEFSQHKSLMNDGMDVPWKMEAQVTLDFDSFSFRWHSAPPRELQTLISVAERLRALIDTTLQVWSDSEKGQNFYLTRPDLGPMRWYDGVECLVCGHLDHQKQVYSRPAQPLPAVTVVDSWLIVDTSATEDWPTLPVVSLQEQAFTTRLLPLDWLSWSPGPNRNWIDDRLGCRVDEYLRNTEFTSHDAHDRAFRFIKLPDGPSIRHSNLSTLAKPRDIQFYMPLGEWDGENHLFISRGRLIATSFGRRWLECHAPGCFTFEAIRLEPKSRNEADWAS